MKKYEVIAKSPFYCSVLQSTFITGSIIEIENINRANELVDAGFFKPVVVKKPTREKVKQDVK